MSIINETWDDGKSYRVKQADGSWKKKSFLHKAKDLLFGDGSDLANNAENNLGAIKGFTKSTNVTEEGYAVDATVINQINSNISIRYNPGTDYIQCYYNGEWHDVYNAKIKWNGYLIKNGVVDTEHWGELIAVGAKGVSEKYNTLDGHTASASVKLLSGYVSMNIKMGSEYYRAGNFYGLKKVQLDTFSKIKLQFKLVHGETSADTIQKTTSVVLFASNTVPNDNSFLDFGIKSRAINVGSVSSLTMLELNVENLTGEYYIGINFNGYSNESATHNLQVYNLNLT